MLIHPDSNPYFFSSAAPSVDPGVSASVYHFTAGPGQVLSFTSVVGNVACFGGEAYYGPDGSEGAASCDSVDTNISAFGGISGIRHTNSTMFLVGVFLGPLAPSGPAPARLTFTDGENFSSLSPLLNQMFFIGDGRRDDNNAKQLFHVPGMATRLVIGFADAYNGTAFYGPPCCYGDNVSSTNISAQNPAGGILVDFEVETPEPSTFLFLSGGLGLFTLVRARSVRSGQNDRSET
jgi:hypothetical protein